MASRVQEAIAAWWAAHPELHALTSDGGLWHVQAAEGVALPYLTFAVVAEMEFGLGGAYAVGRTTAYYFLSGDVVFGAYASTDVEAAAIRNAVRAAIWSSPALVDEGDSPLFSLPGNQSLGRSEGDGEDAADCWVATLEVSIPWQRNP